MNVNEIDRLCKVMHDAYEAAAVESGWETQERSRKPWADVPAANKAAMRAAVRALLNTLDYEDLRAQLAAVGDELDAALAALEREGIEP